MYIIIVSSNALVNSRAFLSLAPFPTFTTLHIKLPYLTLPKTPQRNTLIAQMLHERIVKWWTDYCVVIIKDNPQ